MARNCDSDSGTADMERNSVAGSRRQCGRTARAPNGERGGSARQHKPARDLLLFAGGRHPLGQGDQNPLLEAALEEIPLIGLTDDFQAVKVALAEGGQDLLGLVFDKAQVHGAGQSCRWVSTSRSARAKRAVICWTSPARARW